MKYAHQEYLHMNNLNLIIINTMKYAHQEYLHMNNLNLIIV